MPLDETARLKHLLRRAAYGCRPSEWPAWKAMGVQRAVDALVDYESTPDHLNTPPTDSLGALVAPQDTDSLKRYWLFRFCETARPLEEVMTLFWHGHFATSDYKVQNPSIEWRQNQLLRRDAMGGFRQMLGEIAVDPAMLMWLDGNNSKKQAPNENFSRELMELFAMGVNGGYTERDVKEGAKAFTGWTYNDDKAQVSFTGANHDDGVKNYLGLRGHFDQEAALDIVAHHPATARFISKKLFEFFAYDEPELPVVERLAQHFTKTNLSVRELVRAILSSEEFYSDRALYSRVKTPVQFAVMTVKTLDIPYKWINDMQTYCDNMGQKLFDPPNVKGWKPGKNWINTDSMTARMNFATHAVDELRYRGLVKDHVVEALTSLGRNPDKAFGTAEDAVLSVWSWLLPSASMPDATEKALVAYMKDGAPKDAKSDYFMKRSAGLIELVLTCPEYQFA